MKGMSPGSTPFPWVPQENKTSFERLSARRSMHGVHGVKIVRSRKIFIDFEPSMDLTGGKYHDAGAAGGDARYDRASCALVSYPPPCVKKNRVSTLRWRYDVTFAMSHCSGTSCPNLPYRALRSFAFSSFFSKQFCFDELPRAPPPLPHSFQHRRAKHDSRVRKRCSVGPRALRVSLWE